MLPKRSTQHVDIILGSFRPPLVFFTTEMEHRSVGARWAWRRRFFVTQNYIAAVGFAVIFTSTFVRTRPLFLLRYPIFWYFAGSAHAGARLSVFGGNEAEKGWWNSFWLNVVDCVANSPPRYGRERHKKVKSRQRAKYTPTKSERTRGLCLD